MTVGTVRLKLSVCPVKRHQRAARIIEYHDRVRAEWMAIGRDSAGTGKPQDGKSVKVRKPLSADGVLLLAAQRGDEEAFAALVNRYRATAFRIAYRMVGNHEEAVDIAQEAFLRAFRALDRMDARRGFRSWICRVAVNLSIDALRGRRQAGMQLGHPELATARNPSPEERLDKRWLEDRVQKALCMLPEKYRAILVLREIEGMSPKDMAQVLGCPEATTRWRIHRARVLFKRIWLRQNGREFP